MQGAGQGMLIPKPKFSIKTEVLGGGGAVAEAETEADPPPPVLCSSCYFAECTSWGLLARERGQTMYCVAL